MRIYLGSAPAAPAAQNVTDAGAIASAEAFGTPVVGVGPVGITAAGAIASAEAFGTPVVGQGPPPGGGIAVVFVGSSMFWSPPEVDPYG